MAGMESEMFRNNEMIPWMYEQQWQQSQAQQHDPLAFLERLYTDQIGYYDVEGDEQQARRDQFFRDMIGWYNQQQESAGQVAAGILG